MGPRATDDGRMTLTAITVLLASYLLGCFSTGYYLARRRTGQDLRSVGSGSTGGSNAGRLMGKSGFALTMAGDTVKGAVAVGAGVYFGLAPWLLVAVTLAVVAGHIFPVQLGFRGGKGLATALGALLVFDWRLPLLLLALVGLAWLLSRQMTLSLVGGVLIGPVLAVWLGHAPAVAAWLALLAALLLYAHRPNIEAAVRRLRERGPASG
jgi:acyl phosphate:glycerol-3-phosphate acyltransferase